MQKLFFEQAFETVSKLASDFRSNSGYYLSTSYQEQQVRQDFIDKLFIALGWDVNHNFQKNPYAQEVKVELGLAVGAGRKRADYAFYIAPNFCDVRFYAEAKKPVGLIASEANYFQTLRYGWNSRTPLAILTDFEEFHILDCRYTPNKDTAMQRAVLKFHFSDYDKECLFSNDKTFFIPREDYFLLGILNSKLAWLFFKRLCSVLGDPDKGGRLELRSVHISKFPIKQIDAKNGSEKYRHSEIISLVTTLIELNKQLPLSQTDSDRERITQRIASADRRIDEIVYNLYDLTEKEIIIGNYSRSCDHNRLT